MRDARIAIVGGGVAGLATAWHLARLGQRGVVLLERAPTLGAESSGKNAAVLRSLDPDPVTAELCRAGADFLRSPPRGFSAEPLVDPIGLLVAAAASGAADLARWVRTGGAVGGEPVDPARARALAPHLAAEIAAALWFPAEGRIDVAAEIDGFARGARGGGAAIETGAAVDALSVADGRARGLRLAGGAEISADVVVVAAGGWASKLARAAGSRVALRPTRRHLLVTGVDPAVDPRWPVVWTHTEAFYARPESGGMLVCPCDQTDVDPDACGTDPAMAELALEKAARCLRGLAEPVQRRYWAGMRTFARDERFAVGPDPDVAGLFWVGALGGHGMVAGPAVGEIAARWIATGSAPSRLARELDPARLVSHVA